MENHYGQVHQNYQGFKSTPSWPSWPRGLNIYSSKPPQLPPLPHTHKIDHSKASISFLLFFVLPDACLSSSQVLWCFLYTLFTWHYVAGAVIALLVEVNSITLHTRLMLKLAGAQYSPLYNANKILNVFTYVGFRLSAQFYITWYILHNFSWLDQAGYFLTTMILMNIMILIYFYRLLRADFFPRRKSTGVTQNGTHSSNVTKRFLNDWEERKPFFFRFCSVCLMSLVCAQFSWRSQTRTLPRCPSPRILQALRLKAKGLGIETASHVQCFWLNTSLLLQRLHNAKLNPAYSRYPFACWWYSLYAGGTAKKTATSVQALGRVSPHMKPHSGWKAAD